MFSFPSTCMEKGIKGKRERTFQKVADFDQKLAIKINI